MNVGDRVRSTGLNGIGDKIPAGCEGEIVEINDRFMWIAWDSKWLDLLPYKGRVHRSGRLAADYSSFNAPHETRFEIITDENLWEELELQ